MVEATYQNDSHESPKKVVERLVKASQNQDWEEVEKYYQQDLESGSGKGVAAARFRLYFFNAIEAKEVRIEKSEELFEEGAYTYVGVFYTFLKQNGVNIPQYETFLVHQKKGEYRIVLLEEYPEPIRTKIQTRSNVLRETKGYKAYDEAYIRFLEKDAGLLTDVYQRADELREEEEPSENVDGTIPRRKRGEIREQEKDSKGANQMRELQSWSGWGLPIFYLVGVAVQAGALYIWYRKKRGGNDARI